MNRVDVTSSHDVRKGVGIRFVHRKLGKVDLTNVNGYQIEELEKEGLITSKPKKKE